MAKASITVEKPVGSTFEPFVFDRSMPSVQRLLKAGIPASRLQKLEAEDRITAEELGEPFPAPSLVEKRGR